MHIEVVYATPNEQRLLTLETKTPLTIEEAIEKSGILQYFPEIDLSENKVGIFSKVKKLNQLLRDKDRVEIYRQLIADPKASRKKRAAKKVKKRKQAD